ncbi:MAG: T9SS type A sorting domain-containing protein [Candidatus Kapabacteria bacterium]|nr:T9SS type A sorting domain-containing protein [Candidatus Kapabacteria bacterium]
MKNNNSIIYNYLKYVSESKSYYFIKILTLTRFFKFLSCLILIFITPFITLSQPWINVSSNLNFLDIQNNFIKFSDSIGTQNIKGWKKFKRWEHFWEPRTKSDGSTMNFDSLYKYYTHLKNNNSIKSLQFYGKWQELGPKTNPETQSGIPFATIGRVNCICLNPIDTNIIYIGSATGGIWKSTDYGSHWVSLNTPQFCSQGISDIVLLNKNPNIVFAATGDADGWFSQGSTYTGIIKSIDAGNTWSTINPTAKEDYQIVSKILIDNIDEKVIIAATNRGIIKSRDGGISWITLFQDTYFRDLIRSAVNSQIIFSASYNWQGHASIFKSTDFGDSWIKVFSPDSVNRIKLAASTADKNRIFALCSDSRLNNYKDFYISEDSGTNWRSMALVPDILSGQSFYNMSLAVSDANPSNIFAGGVYSWRTQTGGAVWKELDPIIHVDVHDIKFNSKSGTVFIATDGGVCRSFNNGSDWEILNTGLGITQFYKFSSANQHDNILIGGSQDNGSFLKFGNIWHQIIDGDMLECLFDNEDNTYAYCEGGNGRLYSVDLLDLSYNEIFSPDRPDVNEESAWDAPIVLNPVKSSSLAIGYENIWISNNWGQTWRRISNFTQKKTIRHLAFAPSDTNFIYYTNSTGVYRTSNYGKNWNRILSQNGFVSSLTVDPMNPLHIWLSFGNYDNKLKVLDYDGDQWRNISDGLPNVPVNCLILDKKMNQGIFVGTDLGVFMRNAYFPDWEPVGTGLPDIIVTTLEINYGSGFLRAATFGRGIWELDIHNLQRPEKPQISLTGKDTICYGDLAKIFVTNKSKYKYLWSNAAIGDTVYVSDDNYYSVTAIDTISGALCSSDPIKVNVIPFADLKIIFEGNQNTLCEGDSIRLIADFNKKIKKLQLNWSSGDTSNSIIVNNSGDYTLYGETPEGCTFSSITEHLVFYPKSAKPTISREGNILVASDGTAFQWYLNGYEMQNGKAKRLPIQSQGRYKVLVYNEFSCPSLSDEFFVESSVKSYLDNDQVIIYPNPTSGTFFIESKKTSNYLSDIKIRDLNGEVIQYINDSIITKVEISSSHLNSGAYFIDYTLGINRYSAKIIVLK